MIHVTVKVEGRARQRVSAQPSFRAAALRNGTDKSHVSETFADGDHLYLSFDGTVAGYLSVFLVDIEHEVVTMLLPGSIGTATPLEVASDTGTVFFSRSHSNLPHLVDEIDVSCEEAVELNDIYVAFSPRQYTLPVAARHVGELTSMPLNMFNRWLAKTRTADVAMQLQIIPISIIKPIN